MGGSRRAAGEAAFALLVIIHLCGVALCGVAGHCVSCGVAGHLVVLVVQQTRDEEDARR